MFAADFISDLAEDKLPYDFEEWLGLESGTPKFKANQQHQDSAIVLMLPGCKYVGPVNGPDKEKPVSQVETAVLAALRVQRHNPYLKYNHMDT